MSLLLAGYSFQGPESLLDYKGSEYDNGIFGIFFLKDPEKRVANYGIAYIGNMDEIKETEGFPQAHKKFACWVGQAKTENNLYIGFCPTPGLIPRRRELIEKSLIYKYNPLCNR
jgi:hypothetical protein